MKKKGRRVVLILLFFFWTYMPLQTLGKITQKWAIPLTLEDRAECMKIAFLTYDEFRKPRHPMTHERQTKRNAYFHKWARDIVQQTHALRELWGISIDESVLYQELVRMVRNTSRPDQLRRIWQNLNHDTYFILECFVRPFLVTRLIHEKYTSDHQLHREMHAHVKQIIDQKYFSNSKEIEQWARTNADFYIIKIYRKCRGLDCLHSYKTADALVLNEKEWENWLDRLIQILGNGISENGFSQPKIPVGKVSSIQENDTSLYVTIPVSVNETELTLAIVGWEKPSFEEWWEKISGKFSLTLTTTYTSRELPVLPKAGCQFDTWQPVTTTGAPAPRAYVTGVWTGAEAIFWGGDGPGPYENTGGRYYPSTDSWLPTTTTGAPTGRVYHTAVWTGTEMIIWGGIATTGYTNTGGRYDPSTDSWTATRTIGAPSKRANHTAVWTGGEMIIWGGYGCSDPPGCTTNDFLDTGGRYNPTTDSWTATNTTGAPAKRRYHTAVWTGSLMIVWGGYGCDNPPDCTSPNYLFTGGNYNPSTDSWTPVNEKTAPFAREYHQAVWSGQVMVVWGGRVQAQYSPGGGRYDPSTDTWTATTLTNEPTGREHFRAEWSGSEMIIWGGYGCTDPACSTLDYLNTGGRYDPSADVWSATTLVNAPGARRFFASAMSDSEFIVWGGMATDYLNDGGRYCGVPGSSSVPPVPDGTYASGNPLRTTKQGTSLVITWDPINCSSVNYNLLYGFGQPSSPLSLSGAECVLGTSGSYTWTPPPPPGGETLLWFFVVGFDGFNLEGTWGFDSNGNHRSTSPSGFCSTTDIDTTTACTP